MGSYEKSGGGFQLGIQFNKKKRFNGSANLSFGQISDDDRSFELDRTVGNPTPNSFFRTNFFAINYDLHYNFIKKSHLTLYTALGIGFIRFTARNNAGEDLANLPETRAEGEDFRNSSVMIPTRIGVIYYFDNHVGFGLQTSLLNTSTDYLDNVAELGKSGNDNILEARFSLLIPILFDNE